MTQITQVKWNTDKPKFEDVEGKTVLIWRTTGQLIGMDMDKHRFDQNINNEYFKAFTILSDETVYCEWINKGAYWQGCGGQWSLVYKFCPHCGNPIKVIDELKPLQLMGIEPVIQNESGGFYAMWYKLETEEKFVLKTYPTKREAIESWNLLVKKLTGEK
jgi:hypothetical protein